MFVYSVVFGKNMHFEPNVYKIDLELLLNGNEVLSFGFNDYNLDYSCISVQAKDLKMYVIDFT